MEDRQWALIAGAAEGLGEAFSLRLAEMGFNLIMADIRKESLEALSEKIRKVLQTEICVKCLHLDLARHNAAELCMNEVRQVDCRFLVYNASQSHISPFLSLSPDELDRFIDVNNRTSIKLVHAFANHLKGNGRGGRILLMASLAGLLSPVNAAPYAASKSFLISLTRSLHYEFRPLGIGITVCCAGIVDTPKFRESSPALSPVMMKPEKVAAYALKRTGKKDFCIPGWKNRIHYFMLSRLLPPKTASFFINREMRKMYPGI